jgi:hypothetical protein
VFTRASLFSARPAGEQVLLGYRDPHELLGSYDVAEQRATLEQMAGLLEQLAADATR